MAPKHVLAGITCATFLALGTAAFADEYRADEFFSLDLSKALLSPKRLGPPAEFAPVRVEARTDAKPVRTTRILRHANVEQPRTRVRAKQAPARARLARRHVDPLESQARMPAARIRSPHVPASHIQTWPCRSGGICNWK
jgi:hypothetical protein